MKPEEFFVSPGLEIKGFFVSLGVLVCFNKRCTFVFRTWDLK